ncbi:hypothetical protein [Pseudanabaena sp. PCC 6802]|uniref:hypothetical protein n=1 Tax=Pseudanabaena sp. PCC 6802 TaxID=118173 RepID=UPI00034BA1C7|nr:hypothetical protein [Pseudanabaena sp. PCC 6802]
MPPVGYKTQSADTSVEAELVLFDLLRHKTMTERGQLVQRANWKCHQYALLGIQHDFPHANGRTIRQHYIRRRAWQERVNHMTDTNYDGELMLEDALWLAAKIARIFDRLAIPYYVGGSVASSLQGEIRATEDLDLVADLTRSQADLLINEMSGEFYISDVAVDDALSGRTSSFNTIHQATIEKADIFILRNDAFSRSKMSRRLLYKSQDKTDAAFYLCSAEDIILQKLVWLKMTRNESQKQWRDILGVMKLQGESLDFSYLWGWANTIGVTEPLQQALTESGLF